MHRLELLTNNFQIWNVPGNTLDSLEGVQNPAYVGLVAERRVVQAIFLAAIDHDASFIDVRTLPIE